MSQEAKPRKSIEDIVGTVGGGSGVRAFGLLFVGLGLLGALGDGSFAAGFPLILCALVVVVIGELMEIRATLRRKD